MWLFTRSLEQPCRPPSRSHGTERTGRTARTLRTSSTSCTRRTSCTSRTFRTCCTARPGQAVCTVRPVRDHHSPDAWLASASHSSSPTPALRVLVTGWTARSARPLLAARDVPTYQHPNDFCSGLMMASDTEWTHGLATRYSR